MRKSRVSPPDSFAMLPLLALVPRRGAVHKLGDLHAALFARYEKVSALYQQIEGNTGLSGDQTKRTRAEYALLKSVIDWLESTQDVRLALGGPET